MRALKTKEHDMTKIGRTAITHNGTRVAVSYFAGPWVPGINPGLIKIRPRRSSQFPALFRSIFDIENASDGQIDYFEKDCIRMLPGHPLYAEVKAAAGR
jgi:hypothetical protein